MADTKTASADQPDAGEPRRGPQPLTPAASGFALFLAALWGGNPIAIKAGLDDAPPLRLAWMRFLAGGIIVLTWAISTRQSIRPTRQELRPLAWLALLFTTQIALMNTGQDHTTASHAVVLQSTFPLWTGLFAHFFIPGDRLTPLRVMGTLIAYAGVVAIFAQSLGAAEGTIRGDALLVCSAALLGARNVYTSLTAQRVSMPKLLMAQTVVGIPVFLVAGILIEGEPWVLTDRLLLSIIYQGFIIAGFGFIGNMWLLKHYQPSGVSALALTTPVWGVILSHLVLGEALGPALFLGLALVIAGTAITHWSRSRRLEGGRALSVR